MLVLEDVSVLELQAADRTILLLVGPVPEGDCLRSVSAQRSDVLVVSGEIHCLHTVWVGIEEGAHRCGGQRVPYDKHGVVATVCGHDPALVVGAGRCCDSVAMSLQQLLGFRNVVINDASVR